MMIVEELLNSKGIKFVPNGRDYLVRCLNPDHEDKNPSMRIDSSIGVFNCLSCGYKGNIFNLLGEEPNWLQVRRNKLKELVNKKLVETSGLEIPVNAVPYEWDWRNISKDTYKKFEAFEHTDYPGRLMFPIKNISGRIVVFCGRLMVEGSDRYRFYPPKTRPPMFPSVKPIRNSIILVEGLFDMLNLHDKGLTNTSCLFGVGMPSKDSLNLLKIQGVQTIHLMLDKDAAGIEATSKLMDLLTAEEFNAISHDYGDVKDPGELTASQVSKIKERLYGENYSYSGD